MSKFCKIKKQSNDVLRKIYNYFEGEVLDLDVQHDHLGQNFFVDKDVVRQNYQDCINSQSFSMAASKIHQNYTKKSLKLKQTVIEAGKYSIEANCGVKCLFKVEIGCQNKQIAKNLSGLKYLELYCFPTFKEYYEKLFGGECPVPDYI